MALLALNTVGVVIALLAVLYSYWKWSYQYWKRKGVPYLEPTVPMGNVQSPWKKGISPGDEMVEIYKQGRRKGLKYLGIYMLLKPTFMPLDLDLLKLVVTKDFSHFVDKGLYFNEDDDPISAHLVAIGGVKWRNLRMKFTQTFTSGKMKMMFQTLADCGILLEKYIEEIDNNKEPVDIKKILAGFTVDIIGSCAFGLECNSLEEPDSPFQKFGSKIFQKNRLEEIKVIVMQNFPDIARRLHMRMVPKDVSQFFTNVVQNTVEYREKNGVERKDFLQMLIDIKNNKTAAETGQKGDGTTLTINEIVAQSFVFFIAGFETSSTTMTFALYELSCNQKVQDKVREEIDRVLKKHNNQITYDSLKELEYMDQVINETLRMYPAVPAITRECVEDYKLPDSDIIIEKGTRVTISIKGIHYDEEYYSNPEVFDPERFNAENVKNRPQYAYIPFGEGPRICIGMRFGIMQSKVGLVSILRNHRVTLSSKTQVPLKMAINSFIPNAVGGIWLNIGKI